MTAIDMLRRARELHGAAERQRATIHYLDNPVARLGYSCNVGEAVEKLGELAAKKNAARFWIQAALSGGNQ